MKRIHPHEMKPLESCGTHGDPWISFLGFEGTATSTSWVGDFRVCFPMCSRFFPKLKEPWVSPPVRVQSGIAWNYSPPWEVYQHLGIFLAKSWGPACPWGREHDDQLWVLHFRQNLIYDELWWLIYIEYIEYKRIYMIDTGIHTRPAFFVQRAKEYN